METKTIFTVRYAETDQMGIVHHANYAVWFEMGRTDLLKNVGVAYSTIEAKGILLPLYEMSCKFIAPAKYEDEIAVLTSINNLSRVRISFAYKVTNAKLEKLLASGETMHAWTDKAFKPINVERKIPEIYSILSELTPIMENKH
ncbi:Acyl-CoA thioester hydrolase YbgC [Sporotomaculum syntrophicum]|uniref:Acyl-CoA thioester hydrolase YbgC n=1 Tax=Sporotomaculum syntrophicum TaxID=182264 RepID=A0A9D3AYS9_9FIRM|nr:thioesterase family protein [Sporotomaculum syntrophicum]KAF1085124.1 Acyl-CoA thioester hydrolase YbgC [Sporotomaculum syntrophicum]